MPLNMLELIAFTLRIFERKIIDLFFEHTNTFGYRKLDAKMRAWNERRRADKEEQLFFFL